MSDVLRIRCHRCQREVMMPGDNKSAFRFLAEKQGWQVLSGRWACPQCLAKKKGKA